MAGLGPWDQNAGEYIHSFASDVRAKHVNRGTAILSVPISRSLRRGTRGMNLMRHMLIAVEHLRFGAHFPDRIIKGGKTFGSRIFPVNSLFRNVLRTLHCNTCGTTAGIVRFSLICSLLTGEPGGNSLFQEELNRRETQYRGRATERAGKRAVQLRTRSGGKRSFAPTRHSARVGADKARPSRTSKHRETADAMASCAKGGMPRAPPVTYASARRSQAPIFSSGISSFGKNWAVGAVRELSQDLAP